MTITAAPLVRPAATAELEVELDRLMATRRLQAAASGSAFTELWDIASDCMRGGKLLRPRMLLGAYDALASTDGAAPVPRRVAVRIAAGIELLHFAFLLHDDVLDGDLVRRGRPNLIGRVLARRLAERPADEAHDGASDAVAGSDRARHWAQTAGILMGDLLLSTAHQVFAGEPLPDARRSRLLALVDRTVADSMLGEMLDVAFSDRVRPADLSAVLTMSRLKTATYTFEFPLRASALLTGIDPTIEDAIGRIGGHLGVAFQLQDDLLSTFGRAAEHGKDDYSDLREGKETAIIAFARSTPGWAEIGTGFGDPHLTPAQAEQLRARLGACGAEDAVRTLVDEEMRAAHQILEASDPALPPALVEFFVDLAAALEGRTS